MLMISAVARCRYDVHGADRIKKVKELAARRLAAYNTTIAQDEELLRSSGCVDELQPHMLLTKVIEV